MTKGKVKFVLIFMIFILTGPVHSGKTTLLKKVIRELKKQKLRIDGFLSEAVVENETTIGYDLFDLKEGSSIPFIRRKGEREWEKIGPFFFIPQSLAEAKRIILCGEYSDIRFVDEVGPLELAGTGFWPALEQVVFRSSTRCFLVVRENILERFLEKLQGCDVKVFKIEDEDLYSQMIKELKKAVPVK